MNLVIRILAATIVSFFLSSLFGGSSSAWDDAYRDAVLRLKDPVPVSRELLVISGGISARVELIWTLVALGADRVLLPTSWNAADLSGRDASSIDAELSSRLDEEFARIDKNILELFEAIRIGSIEPQEAGRFVEELQRLVAASNARIQAGVARDVATARVSVQDLMERFGSDRVGLEISDLGLSLPNYPSAEALPVVPRQERGGEQVRRLPYSSFQRYVSQTNQLTARLFALEDAGYFDETDPLNRPSIMHDHLRSLRAELYEQPTDLRRATWRAARNEYSQTVSGLIDEDMQAQLTRRLAELADEEDLGQESAAQIEAMRQELAVSFASARDEYAALAALRRELIEEVEGSFVILEDGAAERINARAAVVNSVIQEEYLYAPTGWNHTLLLTAVGVLLGMILAPFRTGMAVALWPVALAVGAGIFVALLLVADVWIAPVSILVVLTGATGAVTLATGLSQGRAERLITGRAVDRMPSRRLRHTIFRGSFPTNYTGRRRAAIVVVVPEVKGTSSPSVLMSFHRAVSRNIRKREGIVFGEDGLTVFAAFDAGQFREDHRLVQTVCATVQELVSTTLPAGTPVRCGVEIGDLAFYVTPIGGYRATGRTITYARRLSELAKKHRLRALFGDSVVIASDNTGKGGGHLPHFQEQGRLVVSSAGERYPFYSLMEIDQPSP